MSVIFIVSIIKDVWISYKPLRLTKAISTLSTYTQNIADFVPLCALISKFKVAERKRVVQV